MFFSKLLQSTLLIYLAIKMSAPRVRHHFTAVNRSPTRTYVYDDFEDQSSSAAESDDDPDPASVFRNVFCSGELVSSSEGDRSALVKLLDKNRTKCPHTLFLVAYRTKSGQI